MNCPACGAGNNEQVLFCVKCGAQLRPAPPPESWRYSGDLYRTHASEPQREPQRPPQTPPSPHQTRADNAPQGGALYRPPTPVTPIAPAPIAPTANATGGSQLPQVGMTLSIVVACMMLVGLIPCLGWLNWFTIIAAKAALIIGIIGVATEKDPARRGKSMTALIIASVAFVIILVRLLLSLLFGGGCV